MTVSVNDWPREIFEIWSWMDTYYFVRQEDLRPEERPLLVGSLVAQDVLTDYAESLTCDPFTLQEMLEAFMLDCAAPTGPAIWPPQEAILAALMEAVDEEVVVAWKEDPPKAPRRPKPKVEPTPPPAEELAPGTFDLQVVLDGDGSGVGQLSLGVKTHGEGDFRAHRTDGGGGIRIEHVARGVVGLLSDTKGARLDQSAVVVGWGPAPIAKGGAAQAGNPRQIRYLVELEEYHVRDGDTPGSVAARARMSWPDLTYFNWGTRMPEEISRRLVSEVGCTKKGADGGFVFSSGDRPGIIRIPRPFSEEGLVTGKMNVMRVQPLRRTGHIRLRLGIDPRQAAMRHQRFLLFSDDGSFKQEKGVADDLVKGDECLDFEFAECPVDQSYSLEIVQADAEPVRVFEGASFQELHDNREEEGARA